MLAVALRYMGMSFENCVCCSQQYLPCKDDGMKVVVLLSCILPPASLLRGLSLSGSEVISYFRN